MNTKERKLRNTAFITEVLGYSFLMLYWVIMVSFAIFMDIVRWQEYITTGTTSNSLSFGLLLFLTILLGIAIPLIILGCCYYIHKIILYNKWRKELNENR